MVAGRAGTRAGRGGRVASGPMASSEHEGLALALELTELGSELVAQRYRRDHPAAPEAEVDDAVMAWFADRPGAPDGDAVGRRVERPGRT